MRKLTAKLTRSLILSLILGLFCPLILSAKGGTEPEDSSMYRIEGTTDSTVMRDHLQTLLDIIDEQGYELNEEPEETTRIVRVGWMGIADDEVKHPKSFMISDSDEDSELPLEDRPLLIYHTAGKADAEDAIEALMEEMAEALDLEIVDPELPEPDFEDSFRGEYVLDDTDSAIHYVFLKSESLSDNSPYIYLSAHIYPLGSEEDDPVTAIGSLADYLYARLYADELPFSLIAEATIHETQTDVETYHQITYRTTYVMGDITSVTHSILYDGDVTDEELLASLTYLEDHLPDDISGLTDLVAESKENGDNASIIEASWEAMLNRYESQVSFWFTYNLNDPFEGELEDLLEDLPEEQLEEQPEEQVEEQAEDLPEEQTEDQGE